MKKFRLGFTLLFAPIIVTSLASCNKQSINVKRTINLSVSTDVTPTFSSNFGSGSYDPSTKVYTHTIDYIKDLYIYLEAPNLQTETVYIPTSEMEPEVISKSVTFGQNLKAKVKITIEGIKKIEDLNFDSDLYSNLKIGNKNTFTFEIDDRTKNYNYHINLKGYRTYNLKITADQLKGGYLEKSVIACEEGYNYVEFYGCSYYYTIYDAETNDVYKSNSVWNQQMTSTYVFLDSNKEYYAKYNDYVDNSEHIVNLGKGKDTLLTLNDAKTSNTYNGTYMNFEVPTRIANGNGYIYDKLANKLYSQSSYSGSLSDYGYVYAGSEENSNEVKYYYCDDLSKATLTQEDYTNKIILSESNLVLMENVSINTYNKNDNSLIETKGPDCWLSFNDAAVDCVVGTNSIVINKYGIPEGSLEIKIYDKNTLDYITTGQYYIPYNFRGGLYNDIITYNDRTIPVSYPIFEEDITYASANKYVMDPIYVDANITAIQLFMYSDDNINNVSNNAFVYDTEYNVITSHTIGYNKYYDVEPGVDYILSYDNKKYPFKVSQMNIDSGFVIIGDIQYFKVNLPAGYHAIVGSYNNISYNRSENKLYLPITTGNNYFSFEITNGTIKRNISIALPDYQTNEITLDPFYCAKGFNVNTLVLDGVNNGLNVQVVFDDTYFYPSNSTASIYNASTVQINTEIEHIQGSNKEQVTLTRDDFTLNPENHTYEYDLLAQKDCMLMLDGSMYPYSFNIDDAYYIPSKNAFYLNKDATITYNSTPIDLSLYASKYLTIKYTGSSILVTELQKNSLTITADDYDDISSISDLIRFQQDVKYIDYVKTSYVSFYSKYGYTYAYDIPVESVYTKDNEIIRDYCTLHITNQQSTYNTEDKTSNYVLYKTIDIPTTSKITYGYMSTLTNYDGTYKIVLDTDTNKLMVYLEEDKVQNDTFGNIDCQLNSETNVSYIYYVKSGTINTY